MRRPSGLALATFIAICVIAVLSLASARNVLSADVIGAPLIGGTATWYCSDGRYHTRHSRCPKGYGPGDMVAAIDRKDSPFRKGDRVVVRRGSAHVTVTIVDTCACAGGRIIDLTVGAFHRLGKPSAGEIQVTIEPAGRSITPPATDTVRGVWLMPGMTDQQRYVFWIGVLLAYVGVKRWIKGRLG